MDVDLEAVTCKPLLAVSPARPLLSGHRLFLLHSLLLTGGASKSPVQPDMTSPWAKSSSTRFGTPVSPQHRPRPRSAPQSSSAAQLRTFIDGGGSAYDLNSFSQPPVLSAVPNGVYARALWSQENRRKVLAEKREASMREALKKERARALYERVQLERRMTAGRDRASVDAMKQGKLMSSQQDRFELMDAINTSAAANQYAINAKVRLAKQQSFGRVAAARQACLEKKQQARREEGLRQQFALSEKARRLQNLRIEHAQKYANKFALTAAGDFEQSQLFKYSPLHRASCSNMLSPGALHSTASLLMNHQSASASSLAAAAQQQSQQQSQQQAQQAYEEPPPQQYLGTGTAAGMAFQASAFSTPAAAKAAAAELQEQSLQPLKASATPPPTLGWMSLPGQA